MADLSTVSAHVKCLTCGYDLCGLDIAGKCPECATAVVASNPECPRCVKESGRRVSLHFSENSPGAWTCGQCQGVGFEAGFLQKALQDKRSGGLYSTPRIAELLSQTAVMCGHCRTPAASIIVNRNVMFERCEKCGFVWLDAQELEALAAYLKTAIGDRAVPPRVEAVIGDPVALRKATESRASRAGEFAALAIFEIVFAWLSG